MRTNLTAGTANFERMVNTMNDTNAINRYMDWNKAMRIIAEHPHATIFAGLMEDWDFTSGLVYDNGTFCHEYVFANSRWATPILVVDGEEIECWTYEKRRIGVGLPYWWGRTYENRVEG